MQVDNGAAITARLLPIFGILAFEVGLSEAGESWIFPSFSCFLVPSTNRIP
jgi:hypothetical protein